VGPGGDGAIRCRHWRLSGERGLAGERAAVRPAGERLTVGFRAEALIRYRGAPAPGGRRPREVGGPNPLPQRHPSPQPFLVPLGEAAWRPARRRAPDRPRRQRPLGPAQASRCGKDAEVSGG
jgi:hypothetical protein